MIPAKTVFIDSRNAKVLNGNLATEKHGDQKVAFIDLKFEFLLTDKEINAWINPEAMPPDEPFPLIFNKAGKFNLPGISQTAKLRDTLRGELTIEADGLEQMVFDDAHIVGTISNLSFKIGGHGVVVLQLRMNPNDRKDDIFTLIEHGDCMMAFQEGDHDVAKGSENQDEMAV